MPDERTVLMGDDATNGGLFMFVADRPRDLSAGTLYVAKWTQTDGVGPGAGRISWIRLGHATSAEIKALVDSGIKASDIMDVKTSDPGDASYTRIRFNGSNNWVKLVPGMEKAAAFLETHRYAALVGAIHGLHQDGRHDRECRGQARLLGDVLHLQVDDRRHHRHPGPGSGRRRGV